MRKSRKYIVALLAIFPACSSIPDKDVIIDRVETISETKLITSEIGVCSHVWVQTLMKRYQTPERLRAWYAFCYPDLTNPFNSMKTR